MEEIATIMPTKNIAAKSTVKVIKHRNIKNAIPDSLLKNEELNTLIKYLPQNYNFEVYKCIHKIITSNISTVALQFPEGLLMYACLLADIIAKFGNVKVLILGDVTYGACCIDDFTASKLGAELLIHYGHSCLVPVNVTRIKVFKYSVHLFFYFMF
jgi:2-(3-amino-3-carboxypropyl)histidine synthase